MAEHRRPQGLDLFGAYANAPAAWHGVDATAAMDRRALNHIWDNMALEPTQTSMRHFTSLRSFSYGIQGLQARELFTVSRVLSHGLAPAVLSRYTIVADWARHNAKQLLFNYINNRKGRCDDQSDVEIL